MSYHDDPDNLILEAVRPLFAGFADDAYFLRHWRRGPHLRLNIRTDHLHDILPEVDRVVGGFLRDHPSTSVLDVEALLPHHRHLATLENEPGPLSPPRPNNSISVDHYDSRAHTLGGTPAANFLANFYIATNDAAFTALDEIRTSTQRLWTAFDLMVTTARTFGGGIDLGFVSFRAHAENFLANNADQDRLRSTWNKIYRSASPALQARLTTASTSQAAWTDALHGLEPRIASLIADDAIVLPQAPAGGTAPPGASRFVQGLVADENFHRHVLPAPNFRHYRLLLNLLYLQLTRLGIRPVERFMLGHLLANTVEDNYGVDALDLAVQNAKRAANSPHRAMAFHPPSYYIRTHERFSGDC